MRRFLFVLLMILTLGRSFVLAESSTSQPPTLAILDFATKGDFAKGFSLALTEELWRNVEDAKSYKLIERARIIDEIKSRSLDSSSDCVQVDCLAKIGASLDVDYIFYSKLTALDKDRYLFLGRMVDVARGSLKEENTIELQSSIGDLPEKLETFAAVILGIARGRLYISGPAEGTLYLNDKDMGGLPYQNMEAPAGIYKIWITVPGYKDYSGTLQVLHQQDASLAPILVPVYGTLAVTSNQENASVYLNFEKMGTVPLLNEEIRAGKYDLEVVSESVKFESFKQEISILENETTRVHAGLRSLRGRFKIISEPVGAGVVIENKFDAGAKKIFGATPFSGELPTGSYIVIINKNGYGSEKRSLQIVDNKEDKFSVNLKAVHTNLTLESAPKGAKVSIIGLGEYTTPAKVFDIPFGSYTATFTAKNKVAVTKKLDVKAEGSYFLAADLVDTPEYKQQIQRARGRFEKTLAAYHEKNKWRKKSFWGASSLGTVTLLYGLSLKAEADAKYSDYKENRENYNSVSDDQQAMDSYYQKAQDDYDEYSSLSAQSNTMFIGSAVFAVTAAVLKYTTPPPPQKSFSKVSWTMTPKGGVLLAWRRKF